MIDARTAWGKAFELRRQILPRERQEQDSEGQPKGDNVNYRANSSANSESRAGMSHENTKTGT